MASVVLAPGPFGAGGQFLDTVGKPLNAGQINTYAAGTTTPLATFTTSVGNVQNANPIVLGTDGRPPNEIWFTAGRAYKLVLTDSLLNTIATYDNLAGINDPNAQALGTIINVLGTIGGSANAITALGSPTITAYAANKIYELTPASTNTLATTINIDALGARNIFLNGAALTGGELRANIATFLQDDGTQLNIIGNAYLVAGTSAASISAAATVNLDNATGDYVQILGSTAITAVTLAPGRERTLEFAGTPAISSNPTLILPGGTTITAAAGDTAIVRGESSAAVRFVSFTKASGAPLNMSPLTNSLGSDINLTNSSAYFTGPSLTQGTSGTWLVSGNVTVSDPNPFVVSVKLWDGTTVIDSAQFDGVATAHIPIALSGFIANPAGNLRIDVKANTTTTGKIQFNASGNSKDSTITAIRIA